MSGHLYDLYLFQYYYEGNNAPKHISESLRIISYNIHIREYYKQNPEINNSKYGLITNLPNRLLELMNILIPKIVVTKYQIRLPNKIFNENDLKFNPITGKFGILDIATKVE